jgi:hypothetical protein
MSAETITREIRVDIGALKEKLLKYSFKCKFLDYMFEYLTNYKKMCQRRRDAYNIFSTKLKYRHNLISIPLIAVTSGTSVIAALSINKIIVTSLGALAAVLTAVQRFCAYAERAENARMIAKGHSKISRKIEDAILYIKSGATFVDPALFTKQIEDIQKDYEAVNQQANDIPWELLQYIDTVDSHIGCFFPVHGTHRPQIPPMSESFG